MTTKRGQEYNHIHSECSCVKEQQKYIKILKKIKKTINRIQNEFKKSGTYLLGCVMISDELRLLF